MRVKCQIGLFLIAKEYSNATLHFFFREERCYVSGKLDGTAKYFYASGAIETRIYEQGILQGIS